MKTRTLLYLTAVGALVVAPFVAASPAQADVYDDAFLSVLADHGIKSGHGSAGLITAGHAVCADLGRGDTAMGATAKLAQANPDLITDDAAYFVGAAIAAYCPLLAPASWSTDHTERV